MHKAFQYDIRNGCIAHIISKTTFKALDDCEFVREKRRKYRMIATRFNKSPLYKSKLAQIQKEKEVKSITIKQEVATRFEATNTMLRSFLNENKTTVAVDKDKAKRNFDAINEAVSECTKDRKEIEKFLLEKEDLDLMFELVEVLDLLVNGITYLGGDKYVTSSLVLPYLQKLDYLLQPKSSDRKYISDVKGFIRADLDERCDKNLNKIFLSKATFLDRRFFKGSQLSFLDEYDQTNLVNQIQEELKLVVVSSSAVVDSRNKVADSSKEKSKLSSLGFEDSDSDEENENIISAEKELELYMLEKKVRKDSCISEWWRNKCTQYPRLATLAKKYLSLPATSTPAERCMSKMGLVLEKKRLRLKDEKFSKIMYLSDCV